MLLDANVLVYSVDAQSPHQPAASAWLAQAFEGTRRVAIPWQTVGAFVRIVTHPRIMRSPLTPDQAWAAIDVWLEAPVTWVPDGGAATVRILRELMRRHGVTGNLVPDALLAALAIEHGIPIVSADTDFARFPEITWINPVRPR